MSNPPKFYYFGCLESIPGHYLHDETLRTVRYFESPWYTSIDGGILLKGNPEGFREVSDYLMGGSNHPVPSLTEPTGELVFEQKDGWSALAFWDRSGDSRPASNSAFLIDQLITGAELLACARLKFPSIFARKNFPKLHFLRQ